MSINETAGRGRPKSGNALSNAEKQRAYRERKKAKQAERGDPDAEYAALLRQTILDHANPDKRKGMLEKLLGAGTRWLVDTGRW